MDAEDTTEMRDRFLRWRGVEDPCLVCDGAGMKYYGNTSSWRGGMGGAAMTWDVCDGCWGTGDRFRHGCDLKRLRLEEQHRISEAAVEELARSCGASLGSARSEVAAIIQVLRDAADKADKGRRNARSSIWFSPLARGLAATLERALRAP